MSTALPPSADVAIVGAGAAGLAAAIFAGRQLPGRRIVAVDGAPRLGAKILVAGGGRCNVANADPRPTDFWGGSPHFVRRVLAEFDIRQTRAFFEQLGVSLHEEPNGKLFPDTNSGRAVLAALLSEARRVGVEIITDCRVLGLERATAAASAVDTGTRLAGVCGTRDPRHVGAADGFRLRTSCGMLPARVVVLAAGGRALPKSGSDGSGHDLARSLGHNIVEPVAALAPLCLEGSFHAELSGVAHAVELALIGPGEKPFRVGGALLWTHFGVSGPAVLNMSRHWERARRRTRAARLHVNLLPGLSMETAEAEWLSYLSAHPRAGVGSALSCLAEQSANRLAAEGGWESSVRRIADSDCGPPAPARVLDAILAETGLSRIQPAGQLPRERRRQLLDALLERPLAVRGSRGFEYAEATAGGVALSEVEPRGLASRRAAGLFLAGEILDVDGRLGGFNFQWAWSSAWVAAGGVARFLASFPS